MNGNTPLQAIKDFGPNCATILAEVLESINDTLEGLGGAVIYDSSDSNMRTVPHQSADNFFATTDGGYTTAMLASNPVMDTFIQNHHHLDGEFPAAVERRQRADFLTCFNFARTEMGLPELTDYDMAQTLHYNDLLDDGSEQGYAEWLPLPEMDNCRVVDKSKVVPFDSGAALSFAQAQEDVDYASDTFLWAIVATVYYYQDGYEKQEGPLCRFMLCVNGDFPNYCEGVSTYTIYDKCYTVSTLEINGNLGKVGNEMLAAFLGPKSAIAQGKV